MAYSHTTLAQFKSQLSTRLRDITNQFWSDAELTSIISESLYTWQSLTGYWRERATFATVSGTILYDLYSKLSSYFKSSILTSTSISSIQRSLLEPPTPALWSGTSMFTLDLLTKALQNSRNRFIAESGLCLSTSTPAISPPPASREFLDDTVISVFRVVWKDPSNVRYVLHRDTEHGYSSFDSGWSTTPGMPESFSIITTPKLTLQLMPPPIDVGTLEVVASIIPNTLDPANPANTLYIPDNFEWVVRWGAVSELLSQNGEPHDELRAQYAAARYTHGLQLSTIYRFALQWEINGVPVIPSTVEGYDIFNSNWSNETPAQPTDLLLMGNLLATYPVANDIYSITCDVIGTAPIPANDGAFIQIGREEIDTLLGYCIHLAMFKLGGAEFMSTMPLLERYLSQAEKYRSQLISIDRYIYSTMQMLSQASDESEPFAVKDVRQAQSQ